MIQVDAADVRRMLVSHLGLAQYTTTTGSEGIREVFGALGMVQLDPLDKVGTNADLVVHARVHGVRRGQVYDALLPTHAFEHFAKERCLLPASVFPRYRDHAQQAPGWRHTRSMSAVDDAVLDAVEAEIRDRGAVTTRDLTDRGPIPPKDASSGKGKGKLASLAVEVLWTRCRLICVGRTPRGKLWDVPERAIGDACSQATEPDWPVLALTERIRAAGMLPTAMGPWWGMLRSQRKALVQRVLSLGVAQEVCVPGSRRSWLVLTEVLRASPIKPDGRARVLGPLDPLLWDRKLLQLAFDFDYVWEVYKPAAKRRWGYYVCPILQGDRLVARFEAHRQGGTLHLDNLWHEADNALDPAAWSDCWDRLGAFQARTASTVSSG